MSLSAPPRTPADDGQPLLRHLFYSADVDAHDRNSGTSLLVAVLVHALLLFLALSPMVQKHLPQTHLDAGAGTGIGAGPAGGGGGGSPAELTLVDLPAPAMPAPAPVASTAELIPPPPPPPELTLPSVEPPKPITLARADTLPHPPAGAVAGGGQGTGSGSGTGPGTGPGSGGGSGGGTGGGIGSGVGPGTGRGRIMAPEPDFLLLPPQPVPRSVSGRTVLVRLAIDAAGTVRAAELIPPTGNGGFDQALRRTAMGWRFRPARDAANQAVAVTFDITFSF